MNPRHEKRKDKFSRPRPLTRPQSIPMTTPTAASIPAPENWKDVKALFDLGLPEEEEPLAVLEPELELEVEDDVEPVGVADAGGYAAPKALTSKDWDVA